MEGLEEQGELVKVKQLVAAPLVQLDEGFHEAPTAHVEAAARLLEHRAQEEVVEQQDEASVGSALEQQDVSSGASMGAATHSPHKHGHKRTRTCDVIASSQ